MEFFSFLCILISYLFLIQGIMAKNVTIIIEKASDGGFSCYSQEDFEHFGLSGFGDTAEEAKADLLESYNEIKQMEAEEGREVPELEFTWKYDM